MGDDIGDDPSLSQDAGEKLLRKKSSMSVSNMLLLGEGVRERNKSSVKSGSCFTSHNMGGLTSYDDVMSDVTTSLVTSLLLPLSLLCVEFITCFSKLLTSRLLGVDDVIGDVGNDFRSTLMRGDDVIEGVCLMSFVFRVES